jgi:LmbE family N-acetylglucosaminyl deacetylase
MSNITTIEDGAGRCILVVVAHADDLALFLGGTVLRWSDAGWRVVVVRVTDDRWDSVGLSEEETLTRNYDELRAAADVLGVAEIVELGYATDQLGDQSEVVLREKIIRLVRLYRPYALVSFDPYAMYGEDNQDHLLVAACVDEAFWTSQFDLHHPEHFSEGLSPHGCFERWYFGRQIMQVTDAVDIAPVIDRKIEAVLCHSTMLANMLHQQTLQARTGGWRLPLVEEALTSGNYRELFDSIIRDRALSVGAMNDLEMAEQFRVVRFGGSIEMLEKFGERMSRLT